MVVATIEATVVDVVATDSVVALAAVVGSFLEVVAAAVVVNSIESMVVDVVVEAQ